MSLTVATVVCFFAVPPEDGLAAGDTQPTGTLSSNKAASQAAGTSSEFETLFGSNLDLQDYRFYYSSPVTSYLTETDSGYMRVQSGVEGKWLVVAYYDSAYRLQQRQEIPQELPLFGAFYETPSNYYLVSGQENHDESDSVEVFRVTKYDKNWNRQGSCSLYGANTTVPFDAGSCRCADEGKWLVVRTCHEMYTSDDGLNHQANVTMIVDTESMEVTDSFTNVANTAVGYVSHSFNQFVKIDNGKIVSVDHGDAYPRSICLMRYPNAVESGSLPGYWDDLQTIHVLEFPGEIGDNYTGATVGGFEVTSGGYLLVGSYTGQEDAGYYDTKNAFAAYVDRETDAVDVTWLTDYSQGRYSVEAPHLIKVDEDNYMMLWALYDDDEGDLSNFVESTVYYVLLDGTGKPKSETYSMTGRISDCAPIVSNGKVVWYTWANAADTFYDISLSNPDETHSMRFINGSEEDIEDGSEEDVEDERIDIEDLDIELPKSKYRYTGSPIKPKVTVWDWDPWEGFIELKKGVDYKVSYSNNVKIGTAKVTVKGIGNYEGTAVITFKIVKAKAKITAAVTAKKVKASKLKKKAVSFKMKAKSSSGGKLTYKVVKKDKGIKFKNGKVTLKKGTYKKGSKLKVKVKVTTAAKGVYAKTSKYFTLKFIVS